jgi:hypothetical protein
VKSHSTSRWTWKLRALPLDRLRKKAKSLHQKTLKPCFVKKKKKAWESETLYSRKGRSEEQ